MSDTCLHFCLSLFYAFFIYRIWFKNLLWHHRLSRGAFNAEAPWKQYHSRECVNAIEIPIISPAFSERSDTKQSTSATANARLWVRAAQAREVTAQLNANGEYKLQNLAYA